MEMSALFTGTPDSFDVSSRYFPLDAVAHSMRHSWRRKRFNEWLQGHRHEAQDTLFQRGLQTILKVSCAEF